MLNEYMNILVITDDFYPSKAGIAHTINTLCKYFQGREHKLYIVNPFYKAKNIYDILEHRKHSVLDFIKLFKNKRKIFTLLYSFLKIYRFKKIKLFYRINLILYLLSKPKLLSQTITNVYNLIQAFKESKIDLVISAHSGKILPLSFIVSRIFNTKIISMAHGLDFLINSYFSLKHFYFRSIDKFIVSSNWIKRLLIKIQKLDENRIFTIHRGLSLKDYDIKESKSQLRSQLKISENEFVILSVGRHISRKNFGLIIKAIRELKNKDPMMNIKYYSIGMGPMTTELKNLTKNLELEDSVRFLGRCDAHLRNKFYKSSDLFIMPSITEKNNIEGFGIVFIEANYYKVPVIGTYSGGIIEAIVNGKTGLLIRPNDLSDLVDKISFLYKDKQTRNTYGENGYRRVIAEFNWETIIDEYIKAFQSTLGS
ncbi:MAG: glycosyltransferase family 4 protein [Promethearchaeota archaeon]